MEAFFLKYRPQKIVDLDLIDVREGLLKIIKSGKVPHALLFTGPRGTGKTSAARIMAKVVNCEKGERREKKTRKLAEPCNRCQACKEITAGTALDLIEIDAASHTGVDNIRDLREKVKLAPTRLKRKVYIIDEVHMLSRGAFNALLKTLEEPPANTIFILCTTDPGKLPETIISRCTRFNFHKASVEEVVSALKRVVKGEKLNVEKGVLEEIARAVDGSFRDGQKILDQLSSGRKKISLEETKKLLGRIESLAPKKLIVLLAKRKLKEALLEIDRIVTGGGDLAVYTQELLESFRLGLLAKVGLTEFSEPKETEGLDVEEIRFLLELFTRAAGQIKTNPIPQLPLELATVEWCGRKSEGSSNQNKFDSGRTGIKGDDSKDDQNPIVGPKASKIALNEIQKRWGEILVSIRPLNHSVEALLRASRPIEINGEVLTLEVFYRFHKERLEEVKCRQVIEEVTSQVFGVPIKLKCILGEKKVQSSAGQPGNWTAGQPMDESVSSTSEQGPDIIKAAEEIFGTNAN